MSEKKTENIVDMLREQAHILSANGRGGEYLDHAADKIELYEDRITELEDELLRLCDVLGEDDVAIVRELLKNRS